MDSKILEQGGQKQQFMLAVDPESGLPAWVTIMDEFRIHMIGSMLYDYLDKHQLLLLSKNMADKNDFACEMSYNNFKTALLSGEALRTRDMIIELTDFINSPQYPKDLPKGRIYISIFAGDSPNFVSAMIENGNIKFGIKLDGKEIPD